MRSRRSRKTGLGGALFWVLAFAAAGSAVAAPKAGLNETPRAERLLTAAREYLPQDWRYPSREGKPSAAVRRVLEKDLPVQPYEQPDGFSCGPSSLKMLLSAYGKREGIRKLKQVTGTTHDGVDPEGLVRGAKAVGFRANSVYGADVERVCESLSAGNPVLIDYQALDDPTDDPNGDNGHYSVIVAADRSQFLLVDPAEDNAAHLRVIPKSELPRIWWDTRVKTGQRFDGWMMSVQASPNR